MSNLEKLMKFEEEMARYEGNDKVISSHEAKEMIDKLPVPPKFLSKIPSFDNLLDGVEASELITISGKPKQGKSLWAQTLTRNFEKEGHKCLWFSYELTLRQFINRFPILPLFYLPQTMAGKDCNWIEKKIWEAKLKHGCKIIFIDHLGFLKDNENAGNKRVEIDTIVRRLKTMAIKHDVVIFLMWHNKRAPEYVKNYEPTEDDLKESSAIGQDSDVVIMVQRISDKVNGIEDWNTGKGKVSLIFSRRSGWMRKGFYIQLVNGFFEEIDYTQETSNYD